VRVNDDVVDDDRRVIGSSDVTPQGVIKLSFGRKKHVLVRPV
jgi:tyrosyl-tRNA synthetase